MKEPSTRRPNSIAGDWPNTPVQPKEGPQGQLAHPEAIAQYQRLKRRLYTVGSCAWTLVGNGLSNQTFIQAPAGLIAIDTGDSVEEMHSALTELRQHTSAPIVAVIYTHFHYVNGTAAIVEERSNPTLEVYAHADIDSNRDRFGGEVAPKAGRGIVQQFGMALPEQGPDALLHCGLGMTYRHAEHAPHRTGYIPAQNHLAHEQKTNIAGLDVVSYHAPADATDSLTLWFPTLGLCVNNLVWPALFNIYAIRGEPYRDPQTLVEGIDQILALSPQHLISTHGAPLNGPDLSARVQKYRDALQFIWDQTVRGANKGLSLDEITNRVVLPEVYAGDYLTAQLYGLVEHHVRQVYGGLFGWFDEREQRLFATPEALRHKRLIEGFGGRRAVADACEAAQLEDLRWALELASWLVHSEGVEDSDRERMATILTTIAQRTPAANARNWCLTRALELRGQLDLARHRVHRLHKASLLAAEPTRFIPVLRVMLDPVRAEGMDCHVAWHFVSGERMGLHVRHGVAVPTGGEGADLIIGLSHETWAAIAAGDLGLSEASEQGILSIAGDTAALHRFFAAFEHESLNA